MINIYCYFQVDEATLGLRRQLITQGPNHTTVRVYHQLMVDNAMLFGAKNKTQVEAEMWDVIALEAQIAHATHDPQMGEKKQSWYLYLKAFADVANQVSDVLLNKMNTYNINIYIYIVLKYIIYTH